MLYFSKIQDDSHRIIAPISCIMASFHKLNHTDIVGCVVYTVSTRTLLHSPYVAFVTHPAKPMLLWST